MMMTLVTETLEWCLLRIRFDGGIGAVAIAIVVTGLSCAAVWSGLRRPEVAGAVLGAARAGAAAGLAYHVLRMLLLSRSIHTDLAVLARDDLPVFAAYVLALGVLGALGAGGGRALPAQVATWGSWLLFALSGLGYLRGRAVLVGAPPDGVSDLEVEAMAKAAWWTLDLAAMGMLVSLFGFGAAVVLSVARALRAPRTIRS